MSFHFTCCQSFLFVCFYWKNYFIKLRRKREVYVNVAKQETFICISMQNSLQKTFEAEYKNIYKSFYNFSSYFDKGKQKKDYTYVP